MSYGARPGAIIYVSRIQHSAEDSRGTIADVLQDEIIEHVTVIRSKAGAVRGNHFHRNTHQWVYVLSGTLRYVVREREGHVSEGTVSEGELLLTEPMDAHAMVALEDSEMIVFTRGPRGGGHYESDTYRLGKPLIG